MTICLSGMLSVSQQQCRQRNGTAVQSVTFVTGGGRSHLKLVELLLVHESIDLMLHIPGQQLQ